jgi:hypothetical protein
MQARTSIGVYRFTVLRGPVRSLSLAAVLLLFLPSGRAQEDPEQLGVDQGNYNIKQSIEFGGRASSDSPRKFVRWTTTPLYSTA